MSDSPDIPLRVARRSELDRWRRVTLAAWLVGGASFVAALVWGTIAQVDVQPTLPLPSDDITLGGDGSGGQPHRATLATADFGRRLSPSPPPAPAVAKEEAKDTSPLGKLELVAISREGDELVAAIFDPVKHSLFLVRSGESIDATSVVAVEEREVRLAEGNRTRTIRLVSVSERERAKGGGA